MRWALLASSLLVASCAAGSDSGPATSVEELDPTVVTTIDEPAVTTATTTTATTATATTVPEPEPDPIDFHKVPFVAFAPVPPQPDGAPKSLPDGAEDFHDLFEPGAPWANAIANLDAFKLHSWMIRHYLTDEELVRIADFLDEHDVALLIEAEPLDPPDPAECDHTESYEGPYEIENAQRLSDLGITVDAYAIEQPFSYGHKLIGEGACNYSLERVLDEVVAWAADLRRIYPDVPIGSIEALWERPNTTPDDFAVWIDAWTDAMGEPPAFQHVDVNWVIPNWPETLRAIEEVVESRGVPFGPLYNGFNTPSNDEWVEQVMEYVRIYEDDWDGTPGQVSIQSWYPQPDRLLPETDTATMTSLINRYLGARPAFDALARSETTVTGTLIDANGDPLADVPVGVTRVPSAGDRQTLEITGTVPPDANEGVAMVRVNFEDSNDIASDMTLRAVSYDEGDGTNRANGRWYVNEENQGSGRVDGDGTIRVEAAQGQRVLVDGSSFAVTPGATYRFSVDASVSDDTSHGVLGLGFMRDGVEFQRVLVDLSASPVIVGSAVTGADGSFVVDIGDQAPDAALVIDTPGDATTRPARSSVPA